ncbi:MAG TPA: hypothetical protein VLJ39_07115, partial [Tepidisphaeraceae bacterium]|nr:hypothetical protein [Tepidisphaeraceae bacterium]
GFARALRFGSPKAFALASAGLLIVVGTGAAPATKAPAAPRGKAWLEARSVCVFSLGEGRIPQDSNELAVALNQGWKNAITLPDPQKAVFIDGGTYPSVGTLRIDFSEGQLRPAPKKRQKIEVNNKVEKDLFVEHLEVKGQPMLLQKSKLNMKLVADGATIDMERDRRGRPVMLLSHAKSGTLNFDVSRADAEALLLQNAREMASPYGVNVEKMQLLIVPETPRSVQATLYVATKVAFVPAGMLFQAHVTVDNNMNARISGLTCEGDEALGPLIVHFLRPALAKYNNSTRPLVNFPTNGMKLRDVAVRVDDGLHLAAAFGS